MSTLLFDSEFNLNRKRVKLYTSHLYLQVKGFALLEALDSHSKKNGYIKSGHFLLRLAQGQPLFKHRGYRMPLNLVWDHLRPIQG